MDRAFTKPSKYCKPTFLAFPGPAYLNMRNRLVVGKTILLRQKSRQTNYLFRIATKLAKAYRYQLL